MAECRQFLPPPPPECSVLPLPGSVHPPPQHSMLLHVQVIVACAIAGLVAVKLMDVHVSINNKGLDTKYQCLLGNNYMSSSLCT